MSGLIFLYFIGKYYYKLAEDYNQNKWLYVVLGIAVYYAGIFFAGILFGMAIAIFGWDIDPERDQGFGLLLFPFGIGADYLFYYLLKKKWEKSAVAVDEIQDIGNNEE